MLEETIGPLIRVLEEAEARGEVARPIVERAMGIPIDDAFAGRWSEQILQLLAPPKPPPEDEDP